MNKLELNSTGTHSKQVLVSRPNRSSETFTATVMGRSTAILVSTVKVVLRPQDTAASPRKRRLETAVAAGQLEDVSTSMEGD